MKRPTRQVDTSGAGDAALLRVAVASGDEREWHVEALRYTRGGGHDDWSVVLDATGAGAGRLPMRGAAQVVPFVQHTPPQAYDPDYYQTRQQPLRIEIEELTE